MSLSMRRTRQIASFFPLSVLSFVGSHRINGGGGGGGDKSRQKHFNAEQSNVMTLSILNLLSFCFTSQEIDKAISFCLKDSVVDPSLF